MTPNLLASELNWRLLKQANARSATGLDTVLFVGNQAAACVPPSCAQMSLLEAWGYTGPVVATSLSTAKQLARCPAPSLRVFYLWDLEWLRKTNHPHRLLAAVYRDPCLTLVCRTETHRQLVERLWDRPIAGVVEDANLEQIVEVAREFANDKSLS